MALIPALPTAPAFTGISLSPKTNAADRVFTDGTFKGYTFHVVKPEPTKPHGVTSIDKQFDRKLQIIERPLRDGADVKDWGRRAKRFTAEIIFFGPNYLNEFAKFEETCNDGAPGKLILPDETKAVFAYFQSMSIRSSAQEGETLVVSCVWVEAFSKPTPKVASTFASPLDEQINRITEKSTSIAQKIQNVQNAINNNVFIKTLEQSKTNAEQLQIFVQGALNYPATLKASVLQFKANVLAAVAISGQIVNSISTYVFGKSNQTQSTNNVPVSVDPDTGQQVVDFNNPNPTTTVPDPLAKPNASAAVNAPEIKSDQGALDAITLNIGALKESESGLSSSSNGKTLDVSDAILDLIKDLQDVATSIKPKPLVGYLVPFEMSLNEILFFNGLTVDQADQVLRNNPHINDPLVVEGGEVIYL